MGCGVEVSGDGYFFRGLKMEGCSRRVVEGRRGGWWDGEGNDRSPLCYFCSVGLLLVSECL